MCVCEAVMTVFPKDLLSLDTKRKMTMFLDLCATLMRCTVRLKPVTILETFKAALEPAPQGFEENEKMREALGETAIL